MCGCKDNLAPYHEDRPLLSDFWKNPNNTTEYLNFLLKQFGELQDLYAIRKEHIIFSGGMRRAMNLLIS